MASNTVVLENTTIPFDPSRVPSTPPLNILEDSNSSPIVPPVSMSWSNAEEHQFLVAAARYRSEMNSESESEFGLRCGRRVRRKTPIAKHSSVAQRILELGQIQGRHFPKKMSRRVTFNSKIEILHYDSPTYYVKLPMSPRSCYVRTTKSAAATWISHVCTLPMNSNPCRPFLLPGYTSDD